MDEAPEGYEGDVVLVVDGEQPRTVRAVLGARFDPLAGRVVWSGRLVAPLPPGARVVLTTVHGTAAARATETDPWGNTRISGVDRPPFPVELLDAAGDIG